MDNLTVQRLALAYMRRQMWLGKARLAPLGVQRAVNKEKSSSPGGPARSNGAKGKVSPGEFLRIARSR